MSYFVTSLQNSREELTTRKGAYETNDGEEKGSIFILLTILFHLRLNEILGVKWCNLSQTESFSQHLRQVVITSTSKKARNSLKCRAIDILSQKLLRRKFCPLEYYSPHYEVIFHLSPENFCQVQLHRELLSRSFVSLILIKCKKL